MQVKKLDPVEEQLTENAPNGSMWLGEASGLLYIVIHCQDGNKYLWCPTQNVCRPFTTKIDVRRVPPGTKYVISE